MNFASLLLLIFAFLGTIYGIYKIKKQRFYFSVLAACAWFFIIFVMSYQHGIIHIRSLENTHRASSISRVSESPVLPILDEHKREDFNKIDEAYREKLKNYRDELNEIK